MTNMKKCPLCGSDKCEVRSSEHFTLFVKCDTYDTAVHITNEALNSGMSPEPEQTFFQNIWNEYERVVLQSLVTSFGLDFLVHDQFGGDVDTIQNIRTSKDS